MHLEAFRSRRRTVIVGAALSVVTTVLAACSSSGKKSSGEATSSAATQDSGSSAAPSGPKALVKTADVPVGSGMIVDDVVVTQPSSGQFSGFSSVCTHAGCHVSEIVDGVIKCPCHGSKFHLDGSVASGPATKPLETKSVAVQGDSIVEG
jgi:Rieske Fe-S protein